MNTISFILPSYLASYIINDDPSGLLNEEIDEINKFLKSNNLRHCLTCDDIEQFYHRNDMNNMGNMCLKYTFAL